MAEQEQRQGGTSKKVSDHLANERTFLAWIRTGLATITFGFVIERFGLLLRELGFRSQMALLFSLPFSALVGVSLTVLGVAMIIVALLNFLHIRRAIESETFHPPARFAILLTILTSLIGLLLVVYLLLNVS